MDRNRVALSLCLLLLPGGLPFFAQVPAADTILPGDARVDGSIIRAATNAWKMTGTSPGGRRTDGGVWKDKIELVDRNGVTLIRRTQLDSGPEGTTTFITEADQKKLTPILAEVTTAGGFHRVLKFESGHVHSIVTAPPKQGEAVKTRESDVAISQPVFDFDGGMFGLLVAGFPLRENFSAKFPVFDPRNGVAWATYTVIGRERVPGWKGPDDRRLDRGSAGSRATGQDDLLSDERAALRHPAPGGRRREVLGLRHDLTSARPRHEAVHPQVLDHLSVVIR
jgi:hypothetical protein